MKQFRLCNAVLLVVLLLLLCFRAVAAVLPEVKLVNAPRKVAPDEYFTLFFDVTNNDAFSINPRANLVLPEGWTIVTRKELSEVKPGETKKIFFTLRPSRNARVGTGNITLQIMVDQRVVMEEKVWLEIDQVHKVDIMPVVVPDFLREGTSFTCVYLVQNLGNSIEEIQLSSTQGLISGNQKITLEPYTSYSVKVQYAIPPNLSQKTYLVVDLIALLMGTEERVQKSQLVEAYPNSTRKSDPYLRFPIEVSGIYNAVSNGGQQSTGSQFDIRGQGYLDFSKQHYLDFVLHGPNQINLPQFGSFDQYSITYSNPQFAVSALDYTLQVSNLTEFSRFGRGLQMSYKAGDTELTGFYSQPRFFAGIKSTYGGKLTYRPTEHFDFNLNIISKNMLVGDQLVTTDIASISTNYQKNSLWVETEAAANTALGKTDVGGFLRLYYSPKWFRFSSNLVYAGKDFYGYYTNSTLISNTLYSKITRKLMLGAGQNITKVNQSLDLTIYSTLPYYSNYFGEFSYQFSTRDQLRLNYTYREKEDRAAQKQFNYEESVARYSYFHTGKRLYVWLDGEVGRTRNLLAVGDSMVRTTLQNRFMLNYTFFRDLTLGANVEYLQTNRYSALNRTEEFLFYGANALIRLKDYLSFNLYYRNNYALDELTESRNFLNSELILKLNDRHRLSLRGSYAAFPGENRLEKNWLATARYTLLINAPIKKDKSLGGIYGKLSKVSDEKISGVIVQMGKETTITDESGSFKFNDLVPGEYYVTLRRSSLKVDEIADIPLPLEVNVKANEITDIQIPITRSASVKGIIEVGVPVQVGSQASERKKESLVVKLTNNESTFYTETDASGAFSFGEVRSGEWTISVVKTGAWTNDYTIDADSRQISVVAGKDTQVKFRLTPKERKLHMNGGKTIKIQDK
ncbi:hypothetical protein [Telluribacter sp. SYSU D00476]|uniref:hypothetical protein n=1 Tax=Telluribacter sp. SYSU D00476 TaxID=2811430 RepID=UPI001FF22D4E|nr:hypothetical protein [Telluribacter sp. SYSU D00476]